MNECRSRKFLLANKTMILRATSLVQKLVGFVRVYSENGIFFLSRFEKP